MDSRPQIYLLVSGPNARKAAYFAGRIGAGINAAITVGYIERSISFGEWHQLAPISHDELRKSAHDAVETLSEVIAAQNADRPEFCYLEPQSPTGDDFLLDKLTGDREEAQRHFIVAADGASPETRARAAYIFDRILNQPEVKGVVTLIHESLTLAELDAHCAKYEYSG